MTDHKITIGNNIERMRKLKGLTQKDLGVKLNVENNTISAYEKERIIPNATIIKKMAEIFECTTDELLGVKNENTMETEWKNLFESLKKKGYDPNKVAEIIEVFEKMGRLFS